MLDAASDYNLTPLSAVKKWADELGVDIEPDPKLDNFFNICALTIGDPSLHTNSWPEFHEMRRKFFDLPPPRHARHVHEDESATYLMMYILWYEREKQRLADKGKPI